MTKPVRKPTLPPQPTAIERGRPRPPLGVMFLRQSDLCRKLGMSRTKIDSLEMTGRFPQRVRLPGRIIGWRSDEVDQWIDDVSKNRIDIADLRFGKKSREPEKAVG